MGKKWKALLAMTLVAANCLVSLPGVAAAEVTQYEDTTQKEDTTAATEYQSEDVTLEYGATGKFTAPANAAIASSTFEEDYGDNNLLTLDLQGNYLVMAVGDTTVIGRFYDAAGNLLVEKTYNVTVNMDMTGVTLDSTSQTKYMYKGEDTCPSYEFNLIAGNKTLPTDAEAYLLSCESSNSSIAVMVQMEDNGKVVVTPFGAGKTTVTLYINRKAFAVTIQTIEISVNKDSLLLVPKKTGQLKIKGITGETTWSSTNPSVAKVSASGLVTAKKKGNAVIKVVIKSDAGEFTLGCAVSVTTEKRYKAVKKAIRISSTGTYSQPKRMLSGYYDCSSLVWRAYKSVGMYLVGVRSGNAPVAASIGRWCVLKKKMVSGGMSEKNVQAMKLNAGDLMFEEGANNGRYRGIYHVEMIAGYYCKGFDEAGKPIVGITWANRTNDYYPHIGQMVGRP